MLFKLKNRELKVFIRKQFTNRYNMKFFISLFLLSIIIPKLYALNDSSHFFNELSISGNYTLSEDLKSFVKPGFGLGIYHAHEFKNYFAIVGGLEYNMTKQWLDWGVGSSHYYERDVTYSFNYTSIPLLFRFSAGKKFKLFIESGGILDLFIITKTSGKAYSVTPDGRTMLDGDQFSRWNDFKIANYGFNAGIGFQIPCKGFAIIIKNAFIYEPEPLITVERKDLYSRYVKISILFRFEPSN